MEETISIKKKHFDKILQVLVKNVSRVYAIQVVKTVLGYDLVSAIEYVDKLPKIELCIKLDEYLWKKQKLLKILMEEE